MYNVKGTRLSSKFSMYENVWAIINDKICNGWIAEISAPVNENQECTYNISEYTANGDRKFFNKNKVILASELFRTKEELINSL